MNTDNGHPVDDVHAACIVAREQIRADIDRARAVVAAWELGPCPTVQTWIRDIERYRTANIKGDT